MSLKQLSVFLENKPGHLLELSNLLAENKINIQFLSIADTKEYGILRFISQDNEKAKKLLSKESYAFKETEIIAVEIEDQPSILQQILKIEKEAQINIEYMYGMTQKTTQNAIMLFRFDNNEKALNALKSGGFHVMQDHEFYQ